MMHWPGERALNPKQLVRESYERIAPRYNGWAETVRVDERRRYAQIVLQELAPDSAVLDLGCGPGGSTTRALADRCRVVGVDIARANVAFAGIAIPNARFVQGDMTEIRFRPGSFDAVIAFYSLIHVPRDEQSAVLHRVAEWLRPRGLLTLSLGVGNTEQDLDPDFLGSPMYWSSFDQPRNRAMIEQAGFHVLSAQDEVEEEFGQPITFQWIVARRSV